MSRSATAVLFAVALTASYWTVSHLGRGGEVGRGGEGQGTPSAATQPPGRVPVARVAAPPLRTPPVSPRTGDVQAFRLDMAEAARHEEETLRQQILAPLQSDDTTIDEKLDLYRQALRDTFEGTPKEGLLRYRDAFTQILLRAESVQRELAAMSPGDRESALDHIRREMGFSEQEVARMGAADAEREARWQDGFAYMRDRQRIGASFHGEALEEELRHLRERYFGIAARTIALEEESGFFRFERPRVYGVN